MQRVVKKRPSLTVVSWGELSKGALIIEGQFFCNRKQLVTGRTKRMVSNWKAWKRLQHSMALEGWIIPEDKLLEVATHYQESGIESLAEKIATEAEASGRPIAEVAQEALREFRGRCGL